MAASLPWFPCVGLVLGAGLYGLTLLAGLSPWGIWAEGVAFVVVGGGVFLTRGLHLDGLADAADAWGSLASREKMLLIMKDSRVGTFGVLALVLILGAKWVAVARLVESGTAVWIVAAYVISRTAQVELAVALPYARAEGGTARGFIKDARGVHRIAAWTLALVIVAALTGPLGAVALIAGWLVARALGWRFMKMLGGVTGDLLGATSELVETTVLLVCAAAGSHLAAYTGWGFTMDALFGGFAT
jgi:adenosylcobinamide-GDP ribazoletransferase